MKIRYAMNKAHPPCGMDLKDFGQFTKLSEALETQKTKIFNIVNRITPVFRNQKPFKRADPFSEETFRKKSGNEDHKKRQKDYC